MNRQALRQFEGSTPWFVLDTAQPPIPTIGTGHACPTFQHVLAIPAAYWAVPARDLAAVLTSDWHAIQQATGGHTAAGYQYYTQARLTPEGMGKLEDDDVRRVCSALYTAYPWLLALHLPTSWQDAVEDMAFNLGPTFLGGWPKLRGYLRARDPVGCQRECVRILSPTPPGSRETKQEEYERNAQLVRNKWTQQQFALPYSISTTVTSDNDTTAPTTTERQVP